MSTSEIPFSGGIVPEGVTPLSTPAEIPTNSGMLGQAVGDAGFVGSDTVNSNNFQVNEAPMTGGASLVRDTPTEANFPSTATSTEADLSSTVTSTEADLPSTATSTEADLSSTATSTEADLSSTATNNIQTPEISSENNTSLPPTPENKEQEVSHSPSPESLQEAQDIAKSLPEQKEEYVKKTKELQGFEADKSKVESLLSLNKEIKHLTGSESTSSNMSAEERVNLLKDVVESINEKVGNAQDGLIPNAQELQSALNKVQSALNNPEVNPAGESIWTTDRLNDIKTEVTNVAQKMEGLELKHIELRETVANRQSELKTLKASINESEYKLKLMKEIILSSTQALNNLSQQIIHFLEEKDKAEEIQKTAELTIASNAVKGASRIVS